jgi:hypothetical protein
MLAETVKTARNMLDMFHSVIVNYITRFIECALEVGADRQFDEYEEE